MSLQIINVKDDNITFSVSFTVKDLVTVNNLLVAPEGDAFQVTEDGHVGFFDATPVFQQPGATLDNQVSISGETNIIADFYLNGYEEDGPVIKGNIYQLARKLKKVVDALQAYGLLAPE